ncbi:MAG: YbaB/EbfC family nucleoid-associated protein [Xanthomonadales bacterium]|nr:YbaB/EbfC family nucleoid-associated protein [Xanthomonadales bacterium]MCB1629029.1 YbaB/EbfC family nucleoid-associated protein [Xanthomonadales bacterium]MCB1641489.1 YbaB/EbfC family nucleoid-associated protein [Xanthomonadales bacterium]
MRGQMGQLLQQAQKMQEQLQRNMKQAQEALAQMEIEGQAGGGLVSVTLSGRHEARRVRIDRQLLQDDPEMVEDLLAAAINDAVNKVAAASESTMKQATGGMNLPPGFNLPF